MNSSSFLHRRRSPGFTLVELLVVIGIIAILAGVILSGVSSALRFARRTKANTTASQIATAVQNYYTEYGVYPTLNPTTTTDDYYSGTTPGNWTAISYALCGNINPYNPTTPTVQNNLNTRNIAYLSPARSDIDNNGILINPFDSVAAGGVATGPSNNNSPYFYMVVDTDYSGVAGDTGTAPPDFTGTTVTGTKAVPGGVAVWSPCDQALNGSKPSQWAHTF